MELADQLRVLIEQSRAIGPAETARTNHTNPPSTSGAGISVICARTLEHSRDRRLAERLGLASTPQAGDALDVFDERLAIADDLGMDTGEGSTAWNIAMCEARRVVAGVPLAMTSRQPNLIDDALAAFAPLGGLTVQQPQPPGPFDVPDALRDQIGYTRPAAGRAGDESPDSSGPPTPDDLKHRKLDAVITDEPDGIRWDAE